ncbi:hypothetical protein P154DRAFT_616270 [Amniculicola lignicola CBS 123094]|uniref:Uncharacterized protein n=1 Tax=Amniculicola lignicola CBS 123094 TaxID=1392246 RepID=A0A6A5WWX5_9PLEO|nr:hypothetical protein P154DRAFT_616270 [Amniculicola lignicola CBS 123094]
MSPTKDCTDDIAIAIRFLTSVARNLRQASSAALELLEASNFLEQLPRTVKHLEDLRISCYDPGLQHKNTKTRRKMPGSFHSDILGTLSAREIRDIVRASILECSPIINKDNLHKNDTITFVKQRSAVQGGPSAFAHDPIRFNTNILEVISDLRASVLLSAVRDLNISRPSTDVIATLTVFDVPGIVTENDGAKIQIP